MREISKGGCIDWGHQQSVSIKSFKWGYSWRRNMFKILVGLVTCSEVVEAVEVEVKIVDFLSSNW